MESHAGSIPNGPTRLRDRLADSAGSVLAAGVLMLVAVVLGVALREQPPPPIALIVFGGVAACAVGALAVGRYEAAAVLGIATLGTVKFEPSPPDLIFAIVIAVAIATGRFDISKVPTTVAVALGSLCVLNVLSATEAVDPTAAMTFMSITIYLIVFSFWLAGFVDRVGRARALVIAYLFAATASVALGLAALWLPLPFNDFLLYGSEFDQPRIESLFKDANVFGPFLVPAALILLEEIMQPRLLRMRTSIKAALFALMVVGVIFSYSRAAWGNLALGTVVMVAVIALRRDGGRRATRIILALSLATIVASIVVAFSGALGFIGERASFQSYDAERFGAQRSGIELAEGHALGIGPGQFAQAAQLDAHSLYVRVFAEQGFLGLAAILLVMGVTMLLAARNSLTGRHTFGIGSAALFGIWAGLALNSFFVDTLHWRHLWLFAALIWIGSIQRPEAPAVAGYESS